MDHTNDITTYNMYIYCYGNVSGCLVGVCMRAGGEVHIKLTDYGSTKESKQQAAERAFLSTRENIP